MTDEQKRLLVESSAGSTLEGSRCSVAGWRNEEATLTPDFGGFWTATWEKVSEVLSGDKNFHAADVRFSSWRWYGFTNETPPAIRARFPRVFR